VRICYFNRFLNVPWSLGVHGRSLVEAWRAAGHDVLCLPQPLLAEGRGPGPAVGRLAWLPTAIHGPIQDVRARGVAVWHTRRLARQVEQFEPDVLITRRARYDYSLDAVLRRLGTVYIAEVNAVLADEAAQFTHQRMLSWERRREQNYLLEAPGAVCVAEPVRDHLRALGVPDERLRVLPNGVDADLFSPDTKVDRATANWASRFRHVYGHVGTMGPTHDTAGLLDAAAAVLRMQPDAGFLFVGPDLPDLQRQPTWDAALQPRVLCTGRIPHREVPSHLAAADVLWASFRNDHGSPLKLYEFLALAKPVVLAGGGQAVTVVQESGCGTAMPRGDAAQLAAAAVAIADLTPEERCALGEKGRRWVARRHTWAAVADEFARLAAMMTAEAASAGRGHGQASTPGEVRAIQ